MKETTVNVYNIILTGYWTPSQNLDRALLINNLEAISKDFTRALHLIVEQHDSENFEIIHQNIVEESNKDELMERLIKKPFMPYSKENSEGHELEIELKILRFLDEEIGEKFGHRNYPDVIQVNNQFYLEFLMFQDLLRDLSYYKLLNEYYKAWISHYREGLHKFLIKSNNTKKLKLRYLELLHFENICNNHIDNSQDDNIKSCFIIIRNSIEELKDFLKVSFPVQLQLIQSEIDAAQKSNPDGVSLDREKLIWNGNYTEFKKFFVPLIRNGDIKYPGTDNKYAIYIFLLDKIHFRKEDKEITIDNIVKDVRNLEIEPVDPSEEKAKLNFYGGKDYFAGKFVPEIVLGNPDRSQFVYAGNRTWDLIAQGLLKIFDIYWKDERGYYKQSSVCTALKKMSSSIKK